MRPLRQPAATVPVVEPPFVLPTLCSGIDHLGIVGKVAPGIFAQEGRCWRFIYENPSGQAGHCMEPVVSRGRYRYASGWKPVWSCEGHAGELVGARVIPTGTCG